MLPVNYIHFKVYFHEKGHILMTQNLHLQICSFLKIHDWKEMNWAEKPAQIQSTVI